MNPIAHRETRMFRRSLAAVVVLFVIASIVVAGTYNGIITKMDDKEITIMTKKDKKDKEFTEKKVIKVNKDTKFFQGAGKDKDPKESSLGDATKAVETAVEKSPLKGARATVTTDGEGDKEVASKVTIQGGKKGK
jgi:hypothetical protein